MKIVVISDNKFLIEQFHQIAVEKNFYETHDFHFYCSRASHGLLTDTLLKVKLEAIDLKLNYSMVIENYDLVFSLHCQQIFPAQLVTKIKCINVHPGLNPYNRGWFPQVFSILNRLKAGATIHEIDEQLDHGAIIAQREVVIETHDTSLSAYDKIQQMEVRLLEENLDNILSGNYPKKIPKEEGNVNLKKDFNVLREIDLKRTTTMGDAIDYLRAMTHGDYKNAFFVDSKTGRKVFVRINLEMEKWEKQQ